TSPSPDCRDGSKLEVWWTGGTLGGRGLSHAPPARLAEERGEMGEKKKAPARTSAQRGASGPPHPGRTNAAGFSLARRSRTIRRWRTDQRRARRPSRHPYP